MSLLNISAQTALPSKWNGWPFNSGTGSDWDTALATYAFSFIILAAICVFLRLLYGPKGIWRDKELEREAEQAKARELKRLAAELSSGRITELEYKRKVRALNA